MPLAFGDLGQGLSDQRRLGAVVREDDPVRGRHVIEDELRDLAVLEVPFREQDRQARVPVLVGINVPRDVDALGARLVQDPEEARALSPPVLHCKLHVRDLHRDLRLAADSHDLVERGPELAVLAADVADVTATVACGFLREIDDLLARRIDARIVFQAGGEAERASLHAVFHAQAHLLEFFRRRVAPVVVLAHRVDAQVSVPDEGRDVDRDRRLFHPLEQLAHRVGHGTVLARDDRRHALAHDRRRVAHLEQALLVVAVHVDEAGRERETLRVDDGLAAFRLERADFDDPVAVDADGAGARGAARAVDDRGIHDQRGRRRWPAAGVEADGQQRDQRGAAGLSCVHHSNDSLILRNGRPRRPGDQ